MKAKPVIAWAWLLPAVEGKERFRYRDVLCMWAEPTRAKLVESGKPSPEARAVRVEMRPVPKKRKGKR